MQLPESEPQDPSKTPTKKGQSSTSSVDEDETRDNFIQELASVTVQFEVKILCAKEILLRDGTPVKIQTVRGEQKAETSTKTLQSSTVYFTQKFIMKTALERKMGSNTEYLPKNMSMKLLKCFAQKSRAPELLGEAVINLSEYTECITRKMFSVDVQKSQFPEATIDFYLTATPVVGGRSGSTRASSRSNLVTKSQIVQSTRHSESVRGGIMSVGEHSKAKAKASAEGSFLMAEKNPQRSQE